MVGRQDPDGIAFHISIQKTNLKMIKRQTQQILIKKLLKSILINRYQRNKINKTKI